MLLHYANASLPPTVGWGDASVPLLSGQKKQLWFSGVRFWEPWSAQSSRHGHGFGDHYPVGAAAYRRFAGAWFGMFREPRSRALSAYNYFVMRHAAPPQPPPVSFAAYARMTRGTATAMLAGQAHGLECASGLMPGAKAPRHLWAPCSNASRPRPDVATAIARLRGFAFVGLTDEYARSVCLMHAMFGGPCLAIDLENTNPALRGNGSLRHAQPVDDPYDAALYAAASLRFWDDVLRYGASDENCSARICPAVWPRGPRRALTR